MTKVTLNGQELEALPGENLLSLARRNGAHIGFYCDGNGFCTTCECQIDLGAEHLSPVNDVEHAQLAQSRIDRGYRLGCQAGVRGPGPIVATTRAEQLRRSALRVVNAPSAEARTDAGSELFEDLTRLTVEYLSKFPANMIEATMRLGPFRMLWPVKDFQKLIDDGTRILDTMRARQPALPPQTPALPAETTPKQP